MRQGILLIMAFIIVVFGSLAIYDNKKYSEKIDLISSNREKELNELSQKPSITLKSNYQYKSGKHFFVGKIEVPTNCHKINTDLNINQDFAEILISYTIDEDSSNCNSKIIEKTFSIEFEGEQNQNIIAKLNGEILNLDLFEVPQDEDIKSQIN